MATGKEILACATREIGYHEMPGHRTKYGEWYGVDGVAWCMEFVQWVYHEAGADLPYKTASCGELLRWYRKNQPECVVKTPVPGCIVIFDFPGTAYDTDHTGLFVRLEGRRLTTIDGNTSNESEGNGGWVQQRTRSVGYANPVYIVPRELAAEKEENDVKRYNTIEEIKTDAPWAAETVETLLKQGFLKGSGGGLDLSRDMLRLLVIHERMGLYNGKER